jgi:hypothetical protein
MKPLASLRRSLPVGLLLVGALVATTFITGTATTAAAASSSNGLLTQNLSFTTTDGTVLHASIAGSGSLAARPLIVEDSPYAPAASTLDWVGPQFNLVELQWRGTGESGGSLDSTGAQDQSDLAQFLGWACAQPWSNGSIGLYGFSASAIMIYSSLHLQMPCVKAVAAMAGTTDIYRDLFYIGGIANIAAGAFVEGAIGLGDLEDGSSRLETNPSSIPDAAIGFPMQGVDVLTNTTDDAFWQQRTFQGDLDRIPILADTSFYDVEPDGPFAIFNATKSDGSHLLVDGAHDGFPAGQPGPFPQYENWFDHYLLGQPLSAANQPVVSAYLGNGNRQQFLSGNVTHLTGSSWPLTGTQWTSLYLSATKNTTVTSLNDGSLSLSPTAAAKQLSPFIPSELTETDLHNTSVLDSELNDAAKLVPQLNNMDLSGPTSLTYTSAPLTQPYTMVGPGALDVEFSSTAHVTDIYAVVADVWPDGKAYPVATGALRTRFPNVEQSCSLTDAQGDVVDPCNNYGTTSEAPADTTRRYQVELMPMGNVFAPGSRLRLYILGTPADQIPSLPAFNAVQLGGTSGTRLLLPGLGAPQF